MKAKIFLTLALCLSMFTVVFAQKGPKGGKGGGPKNERTAEERATAHTNHLEKKLGLSADQKSQVQAINLAAAQKNDEIRAKIKAGGADKKALSVERRENNKNRVTQIEALLNADQKAKWEAMKAANKKRIEERRKNKGKGPGKEKGALQGEDLEDDGDDD